MFVSFVQRVQVVYSVISDFLDQRITIGWTVSKTFGHQLVDEVSDELNIKGVVQMGDLLSFPASVSSPFPPSKISLLMCFQYLLRTVLSSLGKIIISGYFIYYRFLPMKGVVLIFMQRGLCVCEMDCIPAHALLSI
jgi:hypothetical protein